MTLVSLDHNLAEFLLVKVDMAPLKGHHIDNTKATGVESEEEHLQKLFPSRFLAGLIILQKLLHLLRCQALPVKLGFFVRQGHICDNTQILNAGVDVRINVAQVLCVCTGFSRLE